MDKLKWRMKFKTDINVWDLFENKDFFHIAARKEYGLLYNSIIVRCRYQNLLDKHRRIPSLTLNRYFQPNRISAYPRKITS